jgi:hypothetical protein
MPRLLALVLIAACLPGCVASTAVGTAASVTGTTARVAGGGVRMTATAVETSADVVTVRDRRNPAARP